MQIQGVSWKLFIIFVGILTRILKILENIFDRHIKVIIDKQKKIAIDAILLAPSQTIYCLECVIEVCVDEVELGRNKSYSKSFQMRFLT